MAPTLKNFLSKPQGLRLVIAIDYGGPYTSVAFATPVGYVAHLDEIDFVDNWGENMANLVKVPNVISYSMSTNARERQWGASLSPDAVVMKLDRLGLDIHNTSEELDFILEALDGMKNIQFQNIRDSGAFPSYPWRKPEEMVMDYLMHICDSFWEKLIQVFTEEFIAQASADIVTTLPSDWLYKANNSIFRALSQARFNKDTFPKLTDMLLVSELEAAAIYTARYLEALGGKDCLKKGECFIFGDVGEESVNVISYRVKELQPTEIEAVTSIHCIKSGSKFVNLTFKRWLRDLLEEKYYQELDQGQLVQNISSHKEGPGMNQLMRAFDHYKRKFNRDHQEFMIELPNPLNNLNLDNKVIQGEITVKNDDMRSFFDTCIGDILELIFREVTLLESLPISVRKVFLVGDFMESEYLREEIRYSLMLRDIQLRIPDNFSTAVVCGAAILGIEKPNSSVTMSPITKLPVATGQLLWLIAKGDLILSNQPTLATHSFTESFLEADLRKRTMVIYACDDDRAPERFVGSQHELRVVQTLEYDLMDIPLQEFTYQKSTGRNLPFYTTSLTLTMSLDLRRLNVKLRWKDITLCIADIDCL